MEGIVVKEVPEVVEVAVGPPHVWLPSVFAGHLAGPAELVEPADTAEIVEIVGIVGKDSFAGIAEGNIADSCTDEAFVLETSVEIRNSYTAWNTAEEA